MNMIKLGLVVLIATLSVGVAYGQQRISAIEAASYCSSGETIVAPEDEELVIELADGSLITLEREAQVQLFCPPGAAMRLQVVSGSVNVAAVTSLEVSSGESTTVVRRASVRVAIGSSDVVEVAAISVSPGGSVAVNNVTVRPGFSVQVTSNGQISPPARLPGTARPPVLPEQIVNQENLSDISPS